MRRIFNGTWAIWLFVIYALSYLGVFVLADKNPNKFQKNYGNQSQELVKKLLKQAIKNTDDQSIKKEIRERLKILGPKPKTLVKCRICHKEFESRKYGYAQRKTCVDCRTKMFPI